MPNPVRTACLAALVPAALFFSDVEVAAQTKGRFTAGPQVSHHFTFSDDLGGETSLGVAFSLTRPKNEDGWGPAFGFGWFATDLSDPIAGRLMVRPLLGGYGYTMVRGKYRLQFAALTGPAFAKIQVRGDDRDAWSSFLGLPVHGVDIKNSWVIRPGARLTYSVHPRVGIFGAAEYELARFTLQVQTDTDRRERRLNADVFTLKTGVSFGLF
jgi:hypothetical protein